MSFILLVIAVACERFLDISAVTPRFNWFYDVIDSLPLKLGRYGRVVLLSVTILALPIIVLVIYRVFDSWLFHLVGFALGLIILIYCFGPTAIYAQLESYINARARGEESDDLHNAAKDIFANEKGKNVMENDHILITRLFQDFNSSIAAVIFWFCVLGPFGAVLYRVVSLLQSNARQGKSMAEELPFLTQILNLLDWIPARLVALFYAFMGNHRASFAVLRQYAISGLENNERLLVESGSQAMNLVVSDNPELSLKQVFNLRSLLDKTLIIYLIVLLILMLIF